MAACQAPCWASTMRRLAALWTPPGASARPPRRAGPPAPGPRPRSWDQRRRRPPRRRHSCLRRAAPPAAPTAPMSPWPAGTRRPC
eukprot:365555-Chlamydomonas_euryale.AAC.5